MNNSYITIIKEERTDRPEFAFLLRCVQLDLSMTDLELLSIGLINDMYADSRNDECKYAKLATQEDYDRL